MRLGGLLRDLALGDELGEQLAPLGAELVEAGQGAVAADDDEPVDAVGEQVRRRALAAEAVAEVLGAEGADDRTAAMQDAADVLPAELADAGAAVDHALVALVDRVDLGAESHRCADDRADRRVHPLRVAAAGQDPDALADPDLIDLGQDPICTGHADILALSFAPRAAGEKFAPA